MTVTQGGTRTHNLANGLPCSNQLATESPGNSEDNRNLDLVTLLEEGGALSCSVNTLALPSETERVHLIVRNSRILSSKMCSVFMVNLY